MLKTLLSIFALCGFALIVPAQSQPDIYCHLCDKSEIIKLLPVDFHLSPNQRLQWSPSKRKGRLTLLEQSGECQVKRIWQSKRTTMERAVREFLQREEGDD